MADIAAFFVRAIDHHTDMDKTKRKFFELNRDFLIFRNEIDRVRQENEDLRNEIGRVRQENDDFRNEIGRVRQENDDLRKEVASLTIMFCLLAVLCPRLGFGTP